MQSINIDVDVKWIDTGEVDLAQQSQKCKAECKESAKQILGYANNNWKDIYLTELTMGS